MSLGLDLRGGVYFLYEVDVAGAVKQLLATMERDYRTLLRNERIPFTGIQAEGADAVRITLRSFEDVDRAVAALRKQDTTLTIDGSREGEGGTVTVRLTPDQIKQRQDFAIQQNITTLRNRVDELGVTEPIVARQGVDRITVQLPGRAAIPNEALRVLGATATLEFRLVDDQNDALEAERTGRAPLGSRLYQRREGGPVLLKREVIASGEQLVDASSGFSEGQPAVFVKLDARGAAEMLRDHPREPRPADGRGVHREEARGRGRALQGRARRHRVHRGRGDQRRDHPRRVRQQLPDHRPDGRRGARARAAAAGRLARGAALHRRAAHRRPEPRPGQHRPRRACAADRHAGHVRVHGRLLPQLRPDRQRRAARRTSCC